MLECKDILFEFQRTHRDGSQSQGCHGDSAQDLETSDTQVRGWPFWAGKLCGVGLIRAGFWTDSMMGWSGSGMVDGIIEKIHEQHGIHRCWVFSVVEATVFQNIISSVVLVQLRDQEMLKCLQLVSLWCTSLSGIVLRLRLWSGEGCRAPWQPAVANRSKGVESRLVVAANLGSRNVKHIYIYILRNIVKNHVADQCPWWVVCNAW